MMTQQQLNFFTYSKYTLKASIVNANRQEIKKYIQKLWITWFIAHQHSWEALLKKRKRKENSTTHTKKIRKQIHNKYKHDKIEQIKCPVNPVIVKFFRKKWMPMRCLFSFFNVNKWWKKVQTNDKQCDSLSYSNLSIYYSQESQHGECV